MSNGRGPLREIAWQEVFPWLILLRAFRLAIGFRVLLLAALALIAVVAGWRLIGWAFSGADSEALRAWIAVQSVWPWQEGFGAAGELTYTLDSAAARTRDLPIVGSWLDAGPVVRTWMYLSAPFRALFQADLEAAGLAYSLLCCLWAVFVWALFGGAVTRIAAVALTRGQSIGMGQALAHARGRFTAYLLAPFMPLVGVLLIALVLALFGLVMRLDLGVLLAGIVWPLVLMAGLLMTILLLGLLFGWPLMWPTISAENTDAFDALSRSYAYVYQRPLRLVLYAFVVSLIGLAGLVIVSLFVDSVVYFSLLAVSWGMGEEQTDSLMQAFQGVGSLEQDRAARVGVWLIQFWSALVQMLVIAFQFAFFWVSATAIYLLLRRAVDATDMDEVYLDDAGAAPLPPLETDPHAVPGVKPESP